MTPVTSPPCTLITEYSTVPDGVVYNTDGNLLVQWNNLAIQEYAADQANTLLHTINIPAKHPLTSPVLHHTSTVSQLVTTVDHDTLVYFDATSKSISADKNNSCKLPHSIHSIHHTTHIPAITCIHPNSSITFVTLPDTLHPTHHTQHIDCNAAVDADGTHIVTAQLVSTLDEVSADNTSVNNNFLFITRQHTTASTYALDVYNIKVHTSTVGSDDGTTYSVNYMSTQILAAPSSDARLTSISIHVTSCTINTAWSTGVWQVYQFTADSKLRFGDMTKPLQIKHTRELACYAPNCDIICKAVSQSCVVLVGQSAAATDAYIVSVWESAFGTLQMYHILTNTGEQPTLDELHARSVPAAKKSRKSVKQSNTTTSNAVKVVVAADGKQVSVVMPATVWTCDVSSAQQAAAVPLSSVIGRMKQLQQWIKTNQSAVDNAVEAETALQHSLTSTTKPLTAAKFEAEFNIYYDNLTQKHTHRKPTNGAPANGHTELSPAKRQRIAQKHALLSTRFVNTLALHTLHCIDKSKAASPYCNVLSTLICTNSVSARSTPDLIATLLNQSLYSLLQTAVIHVHDIPESQLVDVLVMALSHFYTDNSSGVDHKVHLTPTIPTSQALVDVVLSAPRSNVFLKQALKSLTTTQLQQLLQYITAWVQCYYYTTEQQLYKARRQHNTRFPSFSQLIDWASILVDTHFTTLLIVSNDKQNSNSSVDVLKWPAVHPIPELVRQLAFMISKRHLPLVETVEQFKGFMSSYSQIEMKRKLGQLTPVKTISNYQVELLQL